MIDWPFLSEKTSKHTKLKFVLLKNRNQSVFCFTVVPAIDRYSDEEKGLRVGIKFTEIRETWEVPTRCICTILFVPGTV